LQWPNKGGRYRDGSEDGESCGSGEGKSSGKESFLAVLFASSWSYTSERELTAAGLLQPPEMVPPKVITSSMMSQTD
jgi:hypothetical protein